jgi:hypothetical protein
MGRNLTDCENTDIQIILKADKSNGTAQAELVEIEDLIKQENAKVGLS